MPLQEMPQHQGLIPDDWEDRLTEVDFSVPLKPGEDVLLITPDGRIIIIPYEELCEDDGSFTWYSDGEEDFDNSHEVASDLNGANGEKTMSDDRNKGQRESRQDAKHKFKNAAKRGELVALKREVEKLKQKGPVYGTRAQPRPKPTPQPRSSVLHPAMHHLVNAFLHPTDKTRPKHGLFTMPHDDSQKARGFAEFDASTGTAGVGFVMLVPATANDQVSIFYSTNAFTGTTTASSGTGIVAIALANLPYATAQIAAPTLYNRIVSYGAHATYVGQNQNRSGVMYSWLIRIMLT